MYWQLYYLRLCGSISCKKNGIKYPLLGATDEPEEGNQRLKIIINLSSNAKLETQQLPWQQIKDSPSVGRGQKNGRIKLRLRFRIT